MKMRCTEFRECFFRYLRKRYFY